jgi:hypothetical protein
MSVAIAVGLVSTTGPVADATPVAAKTCKPTKKKKCAQPADPLGLMEVGRNMRQHSLGDDVIALVFCDAPEFPTDHDATMATLTNDIVPYFAWLSGGRYRPQFIDVGTVVADATKLASRCEAQARSLNLPKNANALMYVHNMRAWAAFGTSGLAGETYPANRRVIEMPQGFLLAGPQAVAHEIGHTLQFPHSFGDRADGLISEYTNRADVMSAPPLGGRDGGTLPAQGTVAINRYQAGWIDPAQVVVHRVPSGTYAIDAISTSSTQMLVIPSSSAHAFTTLEARVHKDFDAVLDEEGIAIHLVDQRCRRCIGAQSRTAPIGPPEDLAVNVPVDNDIAHIVGVGESVTLGNVHIAVLGREGDTFTVSVTGTTYDFPPLRR